MKEKLEQLRGFKGRRLELHKQIKKRKQTGGGGGGVSLLCTGSCRSAAKGEIHGRHERATV